MSRLICDSNICTGCSACVEVCPVRCITMCSDPLDATHPQIDTSICIDCGLCEKTCPNNIQLNFHTPQRVYVAWSNDESIRNTSASGGIATELYRLWISKGGFAAGVKYEKNGECHFILIENEYDILSTQNSKYTFSDTDGIYYKIKEKLQLGVPVIFIGVPCQVSGLYGFLKRDYDNLTTVDIICSGMPPSEYLRQHIKSIEQRRHRVAEFVSFRDPEFNTNTYAFTLRDATKNIFYKKRVLNTDNYQLGYHRALIYRENCYSCKYACRERIADLTIGDFSGLGRCAPFNYDKYNTSCILQNTDKGRRALTEIQSVVTIIERPLTEAFGYERKLSSPAIKHNRRKIFEEEYKKSRDFTRAADKALRFEKIIALRTAFVQTIKKIALEVLLDLHIKHRPVK